MLLILRIIIPSGNEYAILIFNNQDSVAWYEEAYSVMESSLGEQGSVRKEKPDLPHVTRTSKWQKISNPLDISTTIRYYILIPRKAKNVLL